MEDIVGGSEIKLKVRLGAELKAGLGAKLRMESRAEGFSGLANLFISLSIKKKS